MLGTILYWVILGGVVGWIVSLILGRDFRGGCLAYVAVGIVTMVVLGLVLKLFWVLLLIGLVIVAAAWVLDLASRR